MVRCKFKCEVKTETKDGFTIKMVPVTHGSSENDRFFKYTPWGALEVGIINEETAKKLQVGKEYHILISEENLEEEKQEIRALETIRAKYELKYGVRIFADGSEQKIDSQDNPSI